MRTPLAGKLLWESAAGEDETRKTMRVMMMMMMNGVSLESAREQAVGF